MDALTELKGMHIEAKAAFGKIEVAKATERGPLWKKLQPELELHERIEERFVYDPVAEEAGLGDLVLAAWEHEHETQVREADAAMRRIGQLDPVHDGWLQAVQALAKTLEKHIAHEEQDIWPRIRSAWGEQMLETAGRSVAASKAAAKAGASVTAAVAKGDEAAGAGPDRP